MKSRTKATRTTAFALALFLLFPLFSALLPTPVHAEDTFRAPSVEITVVKDAQGNAAVKEDEVTWQLLFLPTEDPKPETWYITLPRGVALEHIQTNGDWDRAAQVRALEGAKDEGAIAPERIYEWQQPTGFVSEDSNTNNAEFMERLWRLDAAEQEELLGEEGVAYAEAAGLTFYGLQVVDNDVPQALRLTTSVEAEETVAQIAVDAMPMYVLPDKDEIGGIDAPASARVEFAREAVAEEEEAAAEEDTDEVAEETEATEDAVAAETEASSEEMTEAAELDAEEPLTEIEEAMADEAAEVGSEERAEMEATEEAVTEPAATESAAKPAVSTDVSWRQQEPALSPAWDTADALMSLSGMAPMNTTVSPPTSGSGYIGTTGSSGSFSTYNWTATPGFDATTGESYIDWEYTVAKTDKSHSLYLDWEIPIGLMLKGSISVSGGNLVDDGNNRYHAYSNRTAFATTDATMTVRFRTTIQTGNGSPSSFSIPFRPSTRYTTSSVEDVYWYTVNSTSYYRVRGDTDISIRFYDSSDFLKNADALVLVKAPAILTILSEDQKGNPISGVVYSVVPGNGTYTTDGNGVATINTGLEVDGDYIITQLSLPTGYRATAENPQTISNLPAGNTEVTFTNTKIEYGTILVNLKNMSGTNLAGGEFEVWTTGANAARVAGPSATDGAGNVLFSDIENGRSYEIRQTKAPVGYSPASSVVIELQSDTTTATAQFFNSNVNLQVHLKHAETGADLVGGVFVLKENGVPVGTPVKTDANGRTSFPGVQLGHTYTIEQTEAPAGMAPMTVPYTVTMNSPSQTVTVQNAPLRLHVTLNNLEGNGLPNSAFVLKNTAGETVAGPLATDADGKVTFTGEALRFGETYTLEQTTVPAGYKPVEPQTVTFTHPTMEWTLTAGQLATLTIHLKNPEGQPLEGAEFLLKDEGIIVSSGTTDGNGTVTLTGLERGKSYTLEQLSSATGYTALAPQTVHIQGDWNVLNLTNTKGPGQSAIHITLHETGKPSVLLAGGEFRVEGPNGAVYTITTNIDGKAVLTNLPNGRYIVVQTKAPNGYLPESRATELNINDNIAYGTVENVYTGTNLRPAIIKVNVKDTDTDVPIQNVTLRATDRLGNVHYTQVDENGIAYFSGLNPLERYTIEVISAPYEYGGDHTYPQLIDIGFIDPSTPFYREVVVTIAKAPLSRIYVQVYEKGDTRVRIPGAQVRITNPDGTSEVFATDANGGFYAERTRDYHYTIQQLTTDATHKLNTEIFDTYVWRDTTTDIPNELIDVASAKRTIKLTKEWGDPKPNSVTSVEFSLLANGKFVTKKSLVGGTGTLTFDSVRKYDENHKMIEYTVKESLISDYYAVYTKNDIDGTDWTVTNYEGSMIGECNKGNFWVSSNDTAYEVTPDGGGTGRSINLKNTSGDDTFGYAIAATPVPHTDGKRYLLAANRPGYVRLYDIYTGQRVDVREQRLDSGTYPRPNEAMNTMGITNDGKWIIVGKYRDPNLYVYSAPAVIDALKNGSSIPNRSSSFGAIPGGNSYTGLAGDVVELSNGDLLYTGQETDWFTNAIKGTGFYIAKKTGDGTYGSAKSIGNVANSGTYWNNGIIEGIAIVNGEIFLTAFTNSGHTHSGVRKITTPISYNMTPTTIQTDSYGTMSQYGRFADATGTGDSTCSFQIKVAGTKLWEGDTPEDRPESITVELLRNGMPTGTTQAVKEENGWSYVFEGLPKYDESGNRILYSVKEVGSVPGYETVYPDPEEEPNNYNITNVMRKTSFHLRKINEQGVALPGAEFTLYGSHRVPPDTGALVPNEQNAVATMVSDANGIVTFEELKAGVYFLRETKAPEGYTANDAWYRVEVIAETGGLTVKLYDAVEGGQEIPHGSAGEWTIFNRKTEGQFSLLKVDQEANPLPGAEFTLKQGDEIVSVQTVDEQGKLTFTGLLPGTYTLTETQTPEGYYPSENEYTVTVDHTGKVTVTLKGQVLPLDPALVVANYKKAQLPIKKVDQNGNVIPGDEATGAQFRLQGVAPLNYDQTVTIDNTGMAVFTDLEPGEYTLQETRAPKDHIRDPKVYQVTVFPDGRVEIRLGEQVLPAVPFEVINQRMTEYPATGGIGREVFFAVGLGLMGWTWRRSRKAKV